MKRPRASILFVALILLSPLGFWACRAGMEARATSTLRAELDLLLKEARGRSGDRPVLRGKPQPGRAWLRYEAVENFGIEEDLLPVFREGLLRTNGARHREWEGPETAPGNVMPTALTKMARTLSGNGKSIEAANLILDLFQYAGDLTRNSSREDWDRADRLRSELLPLLKAGVETWTLPSDEWARLARELELLEQAYPSLRDSLVNTAMSQGCMYVDVVKTHSLLPEGTKPGWRHLFSEKIVTTSAFLDELDCMRRIGDVETAPWAEAIAQAEAARTEFEGSNNPVLLRHSKNAAENAVWLLRTSRIYRAWYRALRTACAWRADGTLLDLDDPFGGKLQRGPGEKGFGVRSRGPGGDDVTIELLIRTAR